MDYEGLCACGVVSSEDPPPWELGHGPWGCYGDRGPLQGLKMTPYSPIPKQCPHHPRAARDGFLLSPIQPQTAGPASGH